MTHEPVKINPVAINTEAMIGVSQQIEASDLKPSTRKVARMLLMKALPNEGYCVSNRREIWRTLKELGPDDGRPIDDISDAQVFKALDQLVAAGILGYTTGGYPGTDIYCGFLAWPRPTPNKPVDMWIRVEDALPRDGRPILALYQYGESGYTIRQWVRAFYHNGHFRELMSNYMGRPHSHPIVQHVTHWAEVEMPAIGEKEA